MRASARQEIDEFLKELTRLRQNDESVLPAMRERAERLCNRFGRCEAAQLVKYFTSLTPAQRTTGLQREAQFAEMRERVSDAARTNVSPDTWRNQRVEILSDLEQLARGTGNDGDATPAARSLALCARLNVEHAAGDSELSDEDRGDLLASAEHEARGSIDRFRSVGMLAPQLEPMWLLARIAAARDEHRAARELFGDCLALARHVDNDEFQEQALDGLIRLSEKAGDLDEMSRLAEELATIRTPNVSWPLARAQAHILYERDQADLAVEFLQRNEPVEPRAKAEWQFMLGVVMLRAGRAEEARQLWTLSIPDYADFELQCRTAALQLRLGNPTEAVKWFGSAAYRDELTPSQRMRADALLGEALMQLNKPSEAIAPLENALELARRTQAQLSEQRGAELNTTNVLGEHNEIGMQTVAWLALANARVGRHIEAARAIEAYQSSTLKAASSSRLTIHSHSFGGTPALSFDVSAWSRHFELGLITWVVGADTTVVAYLAPDGGALALPIAHGRRAIEGAVRRVRELVFANDEAALSRCLHEVRSELLPTEILSQLSQRSRSNRGRLLFLLHGPLERLPVELFALEGEPYQDRCVPVVLPGLPATDPGVPPDLNALSMWTLLGGPVDVAGAQLLPGSLAEINDIADLRAGSTRATGAGFNRESIRRALNGTAALHIATHLTSGCGEDTGRLADVGLELSRGDSFCAREILDAQPSLPLVVLDACETAGGRFVDAEGLQGVSRAFLESGTRNLVVTLWPVDDGSAREFARAFHRALMSGDRPSEAVDRARRELRTSGRAVADWAAFRSIARD
jgi:tetratricopeptide (TPR) repeat protein